MHMHDTFFTCFSRHQCQSVSSFHPINSYLSLEVNEESVASARPPVVFTGRQKPEGSSSELTADDDLDLLDLDLDLI